jgi:hypothetical protein
MKTYMSLMFVVGVSAAVLAAGCARGITNGGGTIPSKYPETRRAAKANFGFWGDSCGDVTTGNFNYHDRSVFNEDRGGGLKMVGPVQDTCDCMTITSDPADEPCQTLCGICDAKALLAGWLGSDGYVSAIRSHYYSSNPKHPGEGTVYACVVDNGEGGKADAGDQLLVYAENGPYDDYLNYGEVRGNIQAYPCPDLD